MNKRGAVYFFSYSHITRSQEPAHHNGSFWLSVFSCSST